MPTVVQKLKGPLLDPNGKGGGQALSRPRAAVLISLEALLTEAGSTLSDVAFAMSSLSDFELPGFGFQSEKTGNQ